MPEGPEVKKMTDFLRDNLRSDSIMNINIDGGRYYRHGPFEGYQKLISLPERKVSYVSCKGKLIWIEINSRYYLTCTLGMTGFWTFKNSKHSHIELALKSGKSLYFNDMRNFGTLKFYDSYDALRKKLGQIGPDLLSDYVNKSTFAKQIRSQKSKTIAEALMNQKVVSGIGNYLKAECLYASRISPFRACNTLTDNEIALLHTSCREIIKLSYETGGATIKNYRQPDGSKGGFSRRFAVYGQKTDPSGNIVIKEKTKDNRVTHWVPKIQH